MRNLIILNLLMCLFLFQTQILRSQSTWEYANHLEGTDENEVICTAKDASDNLFILGQFKDTIIQEDSIYVAIGARDLYIAMYDNTGQNVWIKTIGSSGNEFPGGINLSVDEQSIYVGGGFSTTCFFSATDSLVSMSSLDGFISRYSVSSGDLVWVKSVIRGAGLQRINTMEIDKSGNVITSGIFQNVAEFDTDTLNQALWNVFIAKYDGNGNHLWSKLIETGVISGFSKIESTTSSYYFGGYYVSNMTFDTDTFTNSGGTNSDFMIYKTDTDGNSLWARSSIGAGRDILKSLQADNSDTLYVAGEFESTGFLIDSVRNVQNTIPISNLGSRDIIFLKYDPSGNLIWYKTKAHLYDDFVNKISITNNGYFYLAGSFTDQLIVNNDTLITQGSTDSNPFFAKYDIMGNEIGGVSLLALGGSEDIGSCIRLDDDEFIYVTGDFKANTIEIGDSSFSQLNPGVGQDMFIAKGCPIIGINTLSMTPILCAGDSTGELSIDVVGSQEPYTYLWSNDSTSSMISGVPAGAYTVTVTYAAGQCTKERTLYITESEDIVVDSIVTTDVTVCDPVNGEITVYAKGRDDMSYSIDNGDTFQDDSTFTDLISGEYQFIIKDENDCQITSDIDTIGNSVVSLIIDTVVIQDLLCNGAATGIISIGVSGGNETIEYSINGGSTYQKDSQFVALSSDDYIIAVKDSVTACEFLDGTSTIAQPDSIEISSQTKNDVLCYGLSTGSVIVEAIGGTSPYTYTLYEGIDSITSNATGVFISVSSGNYIVNAVDANDCAPLVFDTSKVMQPTADLTANSNVTNTSAVGASDGEISISASGGTAPYNFRLDAGGTWQTSSDFTSLSAGTYSVFVRDTNMCGPIELTSIQVSDPQKIDDNSISTLIYPNPSANGYFVVEFNDTYMGSALLEIIDLTGKKVFEQRVTKNRVEIHMSNSMTGIYLIKIDGVVQSEKIIVE